MQFFVTLFLIRKLEQNGEVNPIHQNSFRRVGDTQAVQKVEARVAETITLDSPINGLGLFTLGN